MTFVSTDVDVGTEGPAPHGVTRRLGLGRWWLQPLLCVGVVAGALVYVEQRAGVGVRTALACGFAVADAASPAHDREPRGHGAHLCGGNSARNRVDPRAISALLETDHHRGRIRARRRPPIGLIALGAVLFGIGGVGAVIALTVYGALPIVANTVTGLGRCRPSVG